MVFLLFTFRGSSFNGSTIRRKFTAFTRKRPRTVNDTETETRGKSMQQRKRQYKFLLSFSSTAPTFYQEYSYSIPYNNIRSKFPLYVNKPCYKQFQSCTS